jgi:hypothetical protein
MKILNDVEIITESGKIVLEKNDKIKLLEEFKTYSFLVIAETEEEYNSLISNYIKILKENNIKLRLNYDRYYKVGEQFRNEIYIQVDSKVHSLNDVYTVINKIKPTNIIKK